MHDPMTMIWSSPKHRIILWHVDPEVDGSDDSCGWSGFRNNLTVSERDWLRNEGEREWEFWVRGLEKSEPEIDGPGYWPGGMQGASPLELLYAIWQVIVWRKDGAFQRPFASWRMRRRMRLDLPHLLEMVGCGSDNLHSLITEVWRHDERGQKAMGELFVAVARIMRGGNRPWWKHARWHVWHWKLQVRPLQDFKRWAFSRCAGCGGRFRWGYSPVTSNWNSQGPTWRGEPHVYHHTCHGSERPVYDGSTNEPCATA